MTTPENVNEQLDAMSLRLERMTREMETLAQRCASLEKSVDHVIEIMKKSEELFELRSSRVLHNLFSGIVHSLGHGIEHAQDELRLEAQGFDIKVIDGVNIKECASTILVVKKEDGTYDYSPASQPERVMNEQTETFSNYFDKNPHVFGDKTELLVNIIVKTPPAKAEVPV